MIAERSPHAVLDELAGHPRGDDLARLTHTVCFAMADERRADLGAGLAEAGAGGGSAPYPAYPRSATGGRARARGSGVHSGSPGGATRLLLSTLLARGVALSPPEGTEAEERVAESLLWLATHTAADALAAIDAAMGEGAEGVWRSVGAVLRRADAGRAPLVGRAGALVAAAALRASASPAARAEVNTLADEVRDPILRSLLSASGAAQPSTASVVAGELVPRPHGPIALVLLAMTGLLVVLRAARLVARIALGYRCPAEVRVTPRGVTVVSRSVLLGRTLRERETHIPIESLSRATREVRYPRLALYTGIFAVAVGSYVGVSLLVEGVRAASPELIGIGALVAAFGVALDYALVNAGSGLRGKCRVVLVPRKGAPLAVAGLDPALADAALALLMSS